MPKVWRNLTPIKINDDFIMKTRPRIVVLTLVIPGLLVFLIWLYYFGTD